MKKRKITKSFKLIILFILIISCMYYVNNYLTLKYLFNNNNSVAYLPSNPVYDEISSNLQNNGTILDRLNSMKNKDKRIDEIINNYDDYPESLLNTLSKDIDLLDFVLAYPTKKGKVYSNDIGSYQKGTIPLLLQWDERWGYASYGNGIIATTGCAPTSLSMVIVGLTNDTQITPYEVAKYAMDKGYYVNGTGTSWLLFTEGASHFNINSKEIPLSKEVIYNTLKKGHPIIASMHQGDFTTTGHIIVLTGIEDGKIKINDPNSKKRSTVLWEYDRIESQIKNLWEFWV